MTPTTARPPFDRKRESIRAIQRRNSAFVRARRADAVCAHCGSTEKIEFHRVEHAQDRNRRITRMATSTWSLEEIERELALCTPLCKSCHMTENARTGGTPHGSRNAHAKLAETDVAVIRDLLNEGVSGAAIARRFGVSEGTVSEIKTGKIWRRVEEDRHDYV